VLVSFIFILTRYYTETYFVSKIDRIRGNKELGSSIRDYKKLKAELKRKELNEDQKKEIFDKLEGNLKSISSKLSKSKDVQEFNRLCHEFEDKVIIDKSSAEKVYIQLRKLYLKMMEKHPEYVDKDLYGRIKKYYDRLNK
jgi:hypothetical protein